MIGHKQSRGEEGFFKIYTQKLSLLVAQLRRGPREASEKKMLVFGPLKPSILNINNNNPTFTSSPGILFKMKENDLTNEKKEQVGKLYKKNSNKFKI